MFLATPPDSATPPVPGVHPGKGENPPLPLQVGVTITLMPHIRKASLSRVSTASGCGAETRTIHTARRGPGAGTHGFASRLGGRLLIGRMESAPLTTANVLELGPRSGHRAQRSARTRFRDHNVPASAGRLRPSQSPKASPRRQTRVTAATASQHPPRQPSWRPRQASEVPVRARPPPRGGCHPGDAGPRLRGCSSKRRARRPPAAQVGRGTPLPVDRRVAAARRPPPRPPSQRPIQAGARAQKDGERRGGAVRFSRRGSRRRFPRRDTARSAARPPARPPAAALGSAPSRPVCSGPAPAFLHVDPARCQLRAHAARWPTPALGKDVCVGGGTSFRIISFRCVPYNCNCRMSCTIH